MDKGRKMWIDNVRILCILLLIPFHTVMIYNASGEIFYINSTPVKAASMFVFCTYPWWMSGLFVIAGISTVYALKRRTYREYMMERVRRLLIPLLAGILLVIPVQTYLADKFHNGYEGNYWQHYSRFFQITDFGGYDGAFTPGQLWFILYLFVVSMVSIPLIAWAKKREWKIPSQKLCGWGIILVGVIPPVIEPLGDIGGKSLTEFWGWFLIGYFVLSNEDVQEYIGKKWKISSTVAVAAIVIRCVAYQTFGGPELFWGISNTILRWAGILALLGLGMQFLNKKFSWTEYLSKAAFPIYFFHQSWVVIFGYLFVNSIPNDGVAYLLIVLCSFAATILSYEVAKRIGVTRFLFGIKKN